MRVILVPVADRPECAIALDVAFDLGQRLGASVCGCHIRPHRESDVSLPSILDSMADHDATWESAWTGNKTHESSAAARTLFANFAKQHNYPVIKRPRAEAGAVWQEKVGSPDKVLSIQGPISDLIVVSRPAAKGGALARLFLKSALLDTARPVLVLPQTRKAVIGKRITIAWNQSSEAAAAVAAAMPLLQLAEQVTILTCGEEFGAGPKASQLTAYLKYWGIRAQRVAVRDGNDGKAILKGCKESKADLLVMGAYSHNRLRQRIFGGVTEFMLRRASVPVLMLHT